MELYIFSYKCQRWSLKIVAACTQGVTCNISICICSCLCLGWLGGMEENENEGKLPKAKS